MASSKRSSRSTRKRRISPHSMRARSTRAAATKSVNYREKALLEDFDSDDCKLTRQTRTFFSTSAPGKRIKLVLRPPRRRDSSPDDSSSGNSSSGDSSPDAETGRPQRKVKSRNMREVGEDEIPEQTTVTSHTRKYAGAKESFKRDDDDEEFYQRHYQTCDTCSEIGDNDEKGQLVYCQGCTLSFHQGCLGARSAREHLVTKIGELDFVLQCRRCIGLSREKDPLAPDQGFCDVCREVGESTSPFRDRKTSKEEQQEREENHGVDPTIDVEPELINNADNVLFRCIVCHRGWHLHHLPPKHDDTVLEDLDEAVLGLKRFEEYNSAWTCNDCDDAPAEVESIIAWRPSNMDRYEPGQTTEMLPWEAQEYLIKWRDLPYMKSTWMPGEWVWSVAFPATRESFIRNEKNDLPKMTLEEAVPEDYNRIDIVLNVGYTNVVKQSTEKVAKARIKEVENVHVKFKGLGYEDAVWMKPPKPEDTERWNDFQIAYEEWVMGAFVRPPSKQVLDNHLSSIRAQNFEQSIVLSKQPEGLKGGELMSYQMDGLNWLYYQWFQQKNAILADEMGLGKTIQVVGFIMALQQIHSCWPFLIVVPNSTCPNWRRECKKWAPSLRVVTYYGSADARKLSAKYELFPDNAKDLRCHVVVTSYETAQDEQFRKTFRGIKWAGLVVDEGQRLKSGKNLLYGSLNALKFPFKLLLTGTPLQNNARELFNLLQFLDPTINANEMEAEYATLTNENIAKLHSQLQGMFLRRTKAEVLKFLPPMAQIILPVTMSVLQKQVYKTILEKNPELMKSIVGSKKILNPKERVNMNNMLIQLRKCLAHPFVYNKAIEEETTDPDPAQSLRRLVDASSKLQLLEIMLPKLQERGHRVLIFCQFLDGLDVMEDLLTGLGFFYARLDGKIGSLEKQKRIDAFNAPDSKLFAFLLSTRAGGVGINLATADTVIIADPDYNPHTDIQALSRAHRIGQKKKVLVFQMTTRNSAEERMMQIGKKKMTLDHLIIEQMGPHDDDDFNVESILKHGAEALFKGDDNNDIKYDSASVDRLLDRSQIEDTQANDSKTAESQFSFARVWVNDKGSLEEGMDPADETEPEPDPSIWDNILKERARQAQEDRAKEEEEKGRGRRIRPVSPVFRRQSPILILQKIDYSKQIDTDAASSPTRTKKKKNKRKFQDNDSDQDFQGRGESDDDAIGADEEDYGDVVEEVEVTARSKPRPRATISQGSPVQRTGKTSMFPLRIRANHTTGQEFKRAQIPLLSPAGIPLPPADISPTDDRRQSFHSSVVSKQVPQVMPYEVVANANGSTKYEGLKLPWINCILCKYRHVQGGCPLKVAGYETCNLCGIPHYGSQTSCVNTQDSVTLQKMLHALKYSYEPPELKELAKVAIIAALEKLRLQTQDKQRQNGQRWDGQNKRMWEEAERRRPSNNLNGAAHMANNQQPQSSSTTTNGTVFRAPWDSNSKPENNPPHNGLPSL